MRPYHLHREPAKGRSNGQHGRPRGRHQGVGCQQFTGRGNVGQGRALCRREDRPRHDLSRKQGVEPRHLCRLVDEQKPQHQYSPHQIGPNHEPPPIIAVDQHSGQRGRQGPGQHFREEDAPQREGRAGQLRDQDVEGDGVEPVAKQRDDGAHPEPPKILVSRDEGPIPGLLVDVDIVGGVGGSHSTSSTHPGCFALHVRPLERCNVEVPAPLF